MSARARSEASDSMLVSNHTWVCLSSVISFHSQRFTVSSVFVGGVLKIILEFGAPLSIKKSPAL